MLKAACDEYHGKVDMEKRLEKHGNAETNYGTMAVLCEWPTLHQPANDDFDGREIEDIFVEFSAKPQTKLNAVLLERTKKAP